MRLTSKNLKKKRLIMQNKRVIPFLNLLLGAIICCAQTPKEIEQKMDEIKMDEAFIYGEDYNDEKDMAYQNALTELLTSVNEIRADQNKQLLSAPDIQTLVTELRYFNATRHVSFVYMTLNQALSLTPKRTNAFAQRQVRQPQPQKETLQKASTSQNAPMASSATTSATDKDILRELSAQDNWVEIKGLLSSLKSAGKISETGSCRSYSEVPPDAYAILMDQMGGILSILSPKASAKQINHKTNQIDNQNNHTNCKFIVWYK